MGKHLRLNTFCKSICDQICKKGLIHELNFATLMSHNLVCDEAIDNKYSYPGLSTELVKYLDIR